MKAQFHRHPSTSWHEITLAPEDEEQRDALVDLAERLSAIIGKIPLDEITGDRGVSVQHAGPNEVSVWFRGRDP